MTSELNKDAADMSAGDNVSLKYLPRNRKRERVREREGGREEETDKSDGRVPSAV